MTEKITDSKLLKLIIWGDHEDYIPISEKITGCGRWHNHIETVFQRESDKKLFITSWGRGATEYQDHEYPDYAEEAEEFIVSHIEYRAKR